MAPADFIRAFADDPLAAVIITDIDAQLTVVRRLACAGHGACRLRGSAPVIARGLVPETRRYRAAEISSPTSLGAIIGRALFDKTIALEDALAIAADAPGPTGSVRLINRPASVL